MPNIEFDVDKIAKLAMLDLTDDERALMKEQLPSIVAYVSKLQEVDTTDVEIEAYFSELKNIFRQDEIQECATDVRERVVGSFPKKTGDMLEVPGVFE